MNVINKRDQCIDLDISGKMKTRQDTYMQVYHVNEGFQNIPRSSKKLAEELHTKPIFHLFKSTRAIKVEDSFDYKT